MVIGLYNTNIQCSHVRYKSMAQAQTIVLHRKDDCNLEGRLAWSYHLRYCLTEIDLDNHIFYPKVSPLIHSYRCIYQNFANKYKCPESNSWCMSFQLESNHYRSGSYYGISIRTINERGIIDTLVPLHSAGDRQY